MPLHLLRERRAESGGGGISEVWRSSEYSKLESLRALRGSAKREELATAAAIQETSKGLTLDYGL